MLRYRLYNSNDNAGNETYARLFWYSNNFYIRPDYEGTGAQPETSIDGGKLNLQAGATTRMADLH